MSITKAIRGGRGMDITKIIASWTWRLGVAGLAHAVGRILGGGLAAAVGLQPPRAPQPVDAGGGMVLLVYGGVAIALGLAALASGLAGSRWRRWGILGGFAFVVEGAGTAIETSIFTTSGGGPAMVATSLVASFFCAFAVVLLFRPQTEAAGEAENAFAGLGPARRTGRLLLALLAFPASYLLFGMLVAPLVIPYHEQLDFTVVPPMSMILPVVFLRGALFLLVTMPVVVFWRRSRGRLAVALGLGYFTAIGLSGLLQATFFPAALRWIHGVEILASALCTGWALAWLLFKPMSAARPPVSGGRPRVVRRPAAR